MDSVMARPAVEAAGLWIALLILLMLGLKFYVGAQRRKYKVPSGDLSHPEFGRATRIQLNAVEDVPPLLAGLGALALLNAPAPYIHVCGALLFVARILHAWGLSTSSGFSIGRLVGTFGSVIAALAIVFGVLGRILNLL